MPITTTDNAGKLLNRVAVECGLEPSADPFGSTDPSFVQLRYLLNTAGEELAISYPWELLIKQHGFTTLDTDTGNYDLPDDFLYMIDQTGWERKENVPITPVNAQEWAYLLGRDLVTSTIYASFRFKDGKFSLFPQPPPNDLDIHYEYISCLWVQDGQNPELFKQECDDGGDIPQYDRTLISRYLKVKFLEAKGFDTTKAQDDFNQIFTFLTGKDKAGKVLNIGGANNFPYIDVYRNLPDTGYGM